MTALSDSQKRLALAWIAEMEDAIGAGSQLIHVFDAESGDTPMEALHELAERRPFVALEIIRDIQDQVGSDERLLALLAAGQLEHLLFVSGARIVDQIERVARQSVSFRRLMTGVWCTSFSSDVRARVEAMVSGAD